MAIPSYQNLLRPILALAAAQPTTRRSAMDTMSEEFRLTATERTETIPSGGSTLIANRTGWAMTYLTKAGLIEKVAKATYAATSNGRDYLISHPTEITTKGLRQIDGWKDAWNSEAKKTTNGKSAPPDTGPEQDGTPEEAIGNAVLTLEESLRTDLLAQLGEVDPFQFEQIVVDLLFAMGYGGSREEAAKVTKKSNDEGIDGVINEDRLGLDVIYVQAKRWQGTVGRKEIQSFVGALAGKQASKGVFITTSGFSQNAWEYADNVPQRVILIGGQRLTELMIEHCVGVSTSRTIAIKRIDSDYFEAV